MGGVCEGGVRWDTNEEYGSEGGMGGVWWEGGGVGIVKGGMGYM